MQNESSLETAHLLIDSEEAFEELQLSEIEEAEEKELVDSNSYFKYLYECTKELENLRANSDGGKTNKHIDDRVKQCISRKDKISDTKQQHVYARMLVRLNELFEKNLVT